MIKKVISSQSFLGCLLFFICEMPSYFLSDCLITFVEAKAFENFLEFFKHLWNSICDVFNFFINLFDGFSGSVDHFIVDFLMEFVDFYQIVTIEMISMTFAFLITTNNCVFGAIFLGAVFVRLIIAFTVDKNSLKRSEVFVSLTSRRWRLKLLQKVLFEVFHYFFFQ